MEPTQIVLYYLEHQKQLYAPQESLQRRPVVDNPVDQHPNPPQSSQVPLDIYDIPGESSAERNFDWPDSLPAQRIKAGLTEILLGCLLFAGLVAFCLERF
jgi:hypothetical protein